MRGLGFQESVPNNLQSSVTNFIVNIIAYILMNDFIQTYNDYSINEYSTMSNSASNPLPFLYSRVQVIDKVLAGTSGKTIFEFTSHLDYPIDIPTLAISNSGKPRYAYWQYGLPKFMIVYDNNNNIIKKTEQIYNIQKTQFNNQNFLSQSWMPNKMTYSCALNSSTTLTNEIDHDFYYPLTGRAELIETKEYDYDKDNNSTLNSVVYSYSPLNYLLNKTISSNSKGEVVESLTYYPLDYTLSGTIQTLKNQNMVGFPVATQTFITKPDSKYLINGSVNEYGQILNGDIKLLKRYDTRHSGLLNASLVSFSSSQLIPNTTYYKETESILYNTDGKPSQFISENGKASVIYNYDDRIVANINNALQIDVAYTSFEASNKGNWTYDDQYIINDFSPTGKKHFKFPAQIFNISKGGLTASKKYNVSFWSKGGTPYVYRLTSPTGFQNFSPTKTVINTVTGWTYFEYSITNASQIFVDNSLNGHAEGPYPPLQIDELRLYPDDAQMSTLTYDPLIGMTSQSDVNNRITKYEYDGFGRLKLIKDQEGNILQNICYNYFGQIDNCQFYYNEEKTATFTKQCTTGQLGSQHTYTVPLGKYNATTLILANQLAQDDINTNGQSYVNSLPLASCSPAGAVNFTNSTSRSYTIAFTNINTNAVYSFTMSITSVTQQAGLIPLGNYNIQITPIISSSEIVLLNFNGTSQSGASFNINNILINADINFTLSLPYYSGTCSFTPNYGWSSSYNYFSSSNNTVNFNLILTFNSYFNSGVVYTVGTVAVGCRPSNARSFLWISSSYSYWNVIIYPSGSITMQLVNGPVPPPGSYLSLYGLSYNL